ncbi:hypothetical protein CHS0354_017880 [Potamilus streckersoni]|uniref:Uncharacterized protein n=1 Tax=Potamilus streckersoni TaxID=2493646 RepID=A0AAE0T3R4_9BIVA|nr:hypothetical protein CHS0354_017880 [Potamilus streckersoni]
MVQNAKYRAKGNVHNRPENGATPKMNTRYLVQFATYWIVKLSNAFLHGYVFISNSSATDMKSSVTRATYYIKLFYDAMIGHHDVYHMMHIKDNNTFHDNVDNPHYNMMDLKDNNMFHDTVDNPHSNMIDLKDNNTFHDTVDNPHYSMMDLKDNNTFHDTVDNLHYNLMDLKDNNTFHDTVDNPHYNMIDLKNSKTFHDTVDNHQR